MKTWKRALALVLALVMALSLVATGPARGRVPYVEGVNSTGAYFFSKILDGLSTEEIIKDAVKLYETPEEVIAPSFERFIESLLRSGYLEKSEL